MSQTVPRVAVLGSINMDLVARCAKLPGPGETLIADSFSEIPGGKGANQAVAAARAGADVTMIGSLGDDAFAERLRDNLLSNRVDCQLLRACENTPSGTAMIVVADDGENQIVVVPGANAKVTPDDVRLAADAIRNADVLLLQLEIPIDAGLSAITIARETGTRVVLDPAPVPSHMPTGLYQVDLICPNANECAALAESRVGSMAEIEAAAWTLHDRGSNSVVITLGESGAAFFDGQRFSIVDAFETQAVDTTAAGDAFAGALAVRWGETQDLHEAIRFGNAAGSLAASREGAQPSIAERHQILELTQEPRQ
ncbi:MAG: ribokinase [Planctomycetota bacterium]